MHKHLVLAVLDVYWVAVLAAGWFIPWTDLLRMGKRGDDSPELGFVAKVWGGTAAIGLAGLAAVLAGLEAFMLFFGLAIAVFYIGGIALIIFGFTRIRKSSSALSIILCGLLILSAVVAYAYTSAERFSRPKTPMMTTYPSKQPAATSPIPR